MIRAGGGDVNRLAKASARGVASYPQTKTPDLYLRAGGCICSCGFIADDVCLRNEFSEEYTCSVDVSGIGTWRTVE